MKIRSFNAVLTLLVAFGVMTSASALEIGRAKTEARILPSDRTLPPDGDDLPDPIHPLQLELKARLANERFDALPALDVVVTWEQAGGVDPSPFRVLIPAGCFVPNRGFHVAYFRECGVQMSVDLGGRTIALAIREFEARLAPRTDGTARFVMETVFVDNADAHAILGTLGGRFLHIGIGSAMATAPPLRAQTVSGVEPSPF